MSVSAPPPATRGLISTPFSASNSQGNPLSLAQLKLTGAGILLEQSTASLSQLPLTNYPLVWLILKNTAAPQAEMDAKAALAYVRSGGGLLVLSGTGSVDDNSLRAFLRQFHVSINPEPVGPKLQKLAVAPFPELRFFSPKTRLFDVQEEAISEPVLVPNDLRQPALASPPIDRTGFRMILGKIGAGRIALVAADGCFDNLILSESSKEIPKNDNFEILLRLCRWLTARSAN